MAAEKIDPDKKPSEEKITVVVGGQSTVVDIDDREPTLKLVITALQQTNHSGQPPENWELRTESGEVIHDLEKSVGEYGLTSKDQLFLNLKAGEGGA